MYFTSGSIIYWIILGGCMLLSLIASGFVKARFRRGQQVELQSGYTGEQVARLILKSEDITDVEVVEGQGFLSDHYAPTEKALHLSPEVFNGTNAAAAGVAAHEVGHALQHHQGDLSMWGRTILVYPAYFGANFAPLLIMIGAGMGIYQGHLDSTTPHSMMGLYLAYAGVALFGVSTLCSLIVVFNEFNASARARVQLARLGITHGPQEEATVSGVLTAAGLTYLAAAIGSLAQLLYWMWRSGLIGGSRSNN